MTKSNAKAQRDSAKRKNKFVGDSKCKKFGCKNSNYQTFRNANRKCNNCHQSEHILRFYKSYTSLNIEKTEERSAMYS